MDVLNSRVTHGQFGEGTVTGQTDATVTVRFSGEADERKFLYPSAFETFLTLCDEAGRKEMELELSSLHKKADAEHKMREDAERQRLDEERRALLEKKRRTPAKKKPAAKKAAKPEETAE